MEREWWWNEWWMKRAGQHWCCQYLWWSTHDLVLLEAIHLLPVKSMSGNKWRNSSLLLNHPELAQKRKNRFVTVGGLLASAFPWLQPLQLFFCGGGSNSKFEGSSHVQLWLQVAMVSEGYKLKIAFTTASKMTLCVFSCLEWSQIPQKNSEYPRTSEGYERGYGPRGRVSRRQDDSERRSNTKTKFPFLEKSSLQWYEIS